MATALIGINFEARLIGKTPGFTPWKSRSELEASIYRISGAVLLKQPGPGSSTPGLGPEAMTATNDIAHAGRPFNSGTMYRDHPVPANWNGMPPWWTRIMFFPESGPLSAPPRPKA